MGRKKISALRSPFHSNAVGDATFVVGVESANVVTTNVQLKDTANNNLVERCTVLWFLTTDSIGLTTGAALSGGVASGTNGKVNSITAGIMGWATSDAQGRIDFVMTEAGATTRYLVIVMPDGSRKISAVHTWT